MMGGSKKSKRVIWPSDDNLCQVKLFLSEDNPAQVGSGAQDHLQPKAWQSHSNFPLTDDSLPPGFEGGPQPTSIPWNQLSQIPLIKWRCPPRFKLDESWRVTAGEESVELHTENNRVNKVLEAIYPRESAIPPNPVVALNVENSPANDKPPFLIPITPIEDEDAAAAEFADPVAMQVVPTAQTSGTFASSSHNGSAPNPTFHGVDPALLASASDALSAVIDSELLIKILADPKMIEQLVRNYVPSTGPQVSPPTQFNPTHSFPVTNHNMPVTGRVSHPSPSPNPVGRASAQVNRAEFVAAPLTTASKGVFYPSQGPVGPGTNSRPPPVSDIRPDTILPGPSLPVRKDISYYKSLIQQHGNDMHEAPPQFGGGRNNDMHEAPPLQFGGGGGRNNDMHEAPPLQFGGGGGGRNNDMHEAPPPQFGGGRNNNHHGYPGREPTNNGRPRDWKPHPRMTKPCLYYNTEKGCRNGASCSFQHDDKPVQRRVDSQSSKRMKMDREITGT